MEVEAKFSIDAAESYQLLKTIARFDGRIGDFSLGESVLIQVDDTYLDTPDYKVLKAGYALRQRSQQGIVIMTLKSVLTLKSAHIAHSAIHRREEWEVILSDIAPPNRWPDITMRNRLLIWIGDAPLKPLFSLKQSRCVRPIYHNERLVAHLSLDNVSQSAQQYLEAEVELAESGTESDLKAIIAYLETVPGLRPDPRSKFERGLALIRTDNTTGAL